MNNREQIEGNQLIAEFMPDMQLITPANEKHAPFWCRVDAEGLHRLDRHVNSLEYHYDWNWLMPVVFKIKSYVPPHEDEELHERLMNEHGAIWERFWEVLPTVNIDLIWKEVVAFCKWHQSNHLNWPL